MSKLSRVFAAYSIVLAVSFSTVLMSACGPTPSAPTVVLDGVAVTVTPLPPIDIMQITCYSGGTEILWVKMRDYYVSKYYGDGVGDIVAHHIVRPDGNEIVLIGGVNSVVCIKWKLDSRLHGGT